MNFHSQFSHDGMMLLKRNEDNKCHLLSILRPQTQSLLRIFHQHNTQEDEKIQQDTVTYVL